MDETISLSPVAAPVTFTLSGLPEVAAWLHFLLFLISSCALWLPTMSKRSVRPSSIFKANWFVLLETAQLWPAALRSAEPDVPLVALLFEPVPEVADLSAPAVASCDDEGAEVSAVAVELVPVVVLELVLEVIPEPCMEPDVAPMAHEASTRTPLYVCVFISATVPEDDGDVVVVWDCVVCVCDWLPDWPVMPLCDPVC
jgi:hypothetical protein